MTGPGNSRGGGASSPRLRNSPRDIPDRDLYEQALRLLEFRARTAMELRRRLLQRGGSAAEVDAVLQRLLEQKLLDDADYARQFARGKLTAAGASRRRIAQLLFRKGVRTEETDRAIRELTDDEGIDPLSAAARVARKKWTSLASLYAFLARRGFNPDEIRALMAQAGAEIEEPE
jgi:regulatory protein